MKFPLVLVMKLICRWCVGFKKVNMLVSMHMLYTKLFKEDTPSFLSLLGDVSPLLLSLIHNRGDKIEVNTHVQALSVDVCG